MALLNLWQYDRAISDFDEAIRLNPRSALSYAGRAHAWSAKDRPDLAALDWKEADCLNPTAFPR
jgi:tetratricopeptide (TPR) repeat protein